MTASQFRALLLLAVLLVPIAGCATAGLLAGGDPNYPNFTGNWQFTGVATTGGQAPTPVSAFLGALSSSGANVSGTFRLVTTNACVGPFEDVTFSGSLDKFYIATLTSTNLPNNPITITLVADPNTNSPGVGSYTIGGSGPCAMPKTSLGSLNFKPVTGTYAGTLTSNANLAATVTASLTQAPADADGQFPESGTVTVVTPSCTNTFSVTGIVTGATLTATLNQTIGGIPSTAVLAAAFPPDASTLTLPSGLNILGSCNLGSFSGSLKKQ